MTQPLHQSCTTALEQNFTVHKLYEAGNRDAFLAEIAPKVRAIAGGQVNAALMDRLAKLEIIANFGVGYDSIDTAAARARNIHVTNTPNVLNDAMAEMTIGLMIALSRRLPEGDRFVRDGKWPAGGFPLQRELTGKTVGILGLGRIGKEIALRAQAMQMRVVYTGRHRQPREPYAYYDDLLAMAKAVDWLVAVAPGGKATDKMVSREVLQALGPDGMFVNVGRGSVVDEAALVDLLTKRQLGGAALDVFADEPNVPQGLFGLDNVVLSPHQGSATTETRDLMGALVVDNLKAHFAGEPLLTPVV